MSKPKWLVTIWTAGSFVSGASSAATLLSHGAVAADDVLPLFPCLLWRGYQFALYIFSAYCCTYKQNICCVKKGTLQCNALVASLNHFVYLARASVLKCIGRSASLHIWCRSRLCQYCLSLFKRNMVHRIGKIHVTKLEKYRSSVLKCKEHLANVYIWCHS